MLCCFSFHCAIKVPCGAWFCCSHHDGSFLRRPEAWEGDTLIIPEDMHIVHAWFGDTPSSAGGSKGIDVTEKVRSLYGNGFSACEIVASSAVFGHAQTDGMRRKLFVELESQRRQAYEGGSIVVPARRRIVRAWFGPAKVAPFSRNDKWGRGTLVTRES